MLAREPVTYSEHFARRSEPTQLGLMTEYAWMDDPKRIVFTAARYKFVAKMLAGRKSVLEVGCGDAFFSRIVAQHVGSLCVSDRDQGFVDDINSRRRDNWPTQCFWHDMTMGPLGIKRFDGIFALDVLEHITPEDERSFLDNMVTSVSDHGVVIIGSPSLESQKLATRLSRQEHINCKTGEELRCTMADYFHSVFMFGMNDEALHTGHLEMAHYLLAVCVDPRTCLPSSTIGR